MIRQFASALTWSSVVFEVSVQILMLDQVPSKSSRVLNLFPRNRRKISIKFQWDLLIFKTKLFLQQKKKERFRFSKRFTIITKFDNFAGIKLSVCCHQLISSGINWRRLREKSWTRGGGKFNISYLHWNLIVGGARWLDGETLIKLTFLRYKPQRSH